MEMSFHILNVSIFTSPCHVVFAVSKHFIFAQLVFRINLIQVKKNCNTLLYFTGPSFAEYFQQVSLKELRNLVLIVGGIGQLDLN